MERGLGTVPAPAGVPGIYSLAWPQSPAVPLSPSQLFMISAVPTSLAPGCTPAAHPCLPAVPSRVFLVLGSAPGEGVGAGPGLPSGGCGWPVQ